MKRRMGRLAMALLLAGLCLGFTLPAAAASWDDKSEVYWTGRSVERLLSDDFLDDLNLSRRQRDAIEDLRRDNRYDRRSDSMNDLEDILDVLLRGGIIGSSRERDLDSDLDYLLRTDDDFLYRFYQVLDPDQRRIARNRIDRWYDEDLSRGWHFGQRRWELSRELERRLQLSSSQRKEIDRILRRAEREIRNREKRVWEREREYFRNYWDPSSARSDSKYRRQLLDSRRDVWLMTKEVRTDIRRVLNSRQRRIFDSWNGPLFEGSLGTGGFRPGKYKNDK
jgi:hypothetical protein